MNPACPYCNNESVLVSGDWIYPHRPDLFNKWFYVCWKDDAYVGCHPGTKNPLGRLANASLRKAKSAAHAAFDPKWKTKQMKRGAAYHWLAQQLGVLDKECHIGMFDLETCIKVVEVCKGTK